MSANIPDVEVRKVIVEEVTQAQLGAEAKLAQETARREELEAQLADSEAFQEYRWQAEFQRAEAERQAEDRLEFTKQKAEKGKAGAAEHPGKRRSGTPPKPLTKEQEKAARKEAQWSAEREKAAQAAADALNQEKGLFPAGGRAERAMEAQSQAAAKPLAKAKKKTARQADAHQAAIEAEKAAQDAQAALQAWLSLGEQTLKRRSQGRSGRCLPGSLQAARDYRRSEAGGGGAQGCPGAVGADQDCRAGGAGAGAGSPRPGTEGTGTGPSGGNRPGGSPGQAGGKIPLPGDWWMPSPTGAIPSGMPQRRKNPGKRKKSSN